MRLEGGSQFAGYAVVSRLGRGGMATVYLVRESGLNRLVALKVLPEHLSDDPQFAGRFEQEAQVVAGLDHPNIIPLYRFGITDETPWMALRYVDGGDFAARLTARPLAVPEGLGILRAVAAALDYAHRKGVVHRDFKPQNILLSGEGAPYLADFGVAKLLEGSGRMKTATGGILGTPAYMAPEQAQGLRLGPYTDVYALAIICFQWLTGSLPFDADTPHAILMKQVTQALPAEALATLSPNVAAVLQRGLDKQPEARQTSAGELVDELEQALYSPATVATPAGARSKAMAVAAPEDAQIDGVAARSRARRASANNVAGASRAAAPRRRNIALPLAFGALVLASGAYVVWRETRPPATVQVAADAARGGEAKPPAVEVQQPPVPAVATVAKGDAPSTRPATHGTDSSPALQVPGLDADGLIERIVEARGGLAKLKSIRTVTSITIEHKSDGTEVAHAFGIKRPRRIRVQSSGPNFELIQIFDGRQGWIRSRVGFQSNSAALSPGLAKELAYIADIDGAYLDYRAKGNRVEFGGTERVHGVSAYVLKVSHANADVDIVYADPDSFLPVRIVTRHRIDGVNAETTIDFSDYRTIGGVAVSFAQHVRVRGPAPSDSRFVAQNVEFNVDLDDDLFRSDGGAFDD